MWWPCKDKTSLVNDKIWISRLIRLNEWFWMGEKKADFRSPLIKTCPNVALVTEAYDHQLATNKNEFQAELRILC